MITSVRVLGVASIALASVMYAGGMNRDLRRTVAPVVQSNPNTEPAGVLRGGVLAVTLEARMSGWRFSDGRSPMTIAAFSEPGKPPLMPGPLVRVPSGTEVRATIRNDLAMPVTFLVPASMHGGPDRIDAMDSIVVAPGSVATLTTHATVPGNYVYRATLPDGPDKVNHIAGLLAGAVIVDTARAPARPRDRVIVIMATEDSASLVCDDTVKGNPLAGCHGRRFMYTLNGRSWPNTERLDATVGDSLRWRVINASNQVHPMHLHGFYFRVDGLSGPRVDEGERPVPGQMVVTQVLDGLSSMSMTWSPDRPGNWLFHCHVALHNTPYRLVAMPDDPQMRDMVGLVLGVIVKGGISVPTAGNNVPTRRVRLVAESEVSPRNGRDTLPLMHFVLDEPGRTNDMHAEASSELDLVRSEPVAITIVNHLDEPTVVHWHGIEVEDSYMDGAAGFGGAGKRLAPAIAPGDSFVARFTPPRSGTFMYHAHLDELHQELAGLEGVLVVRDPGNSPSPDDHAFLLKGSSNDALHPMELNGSIAPDTVVLHVGRTARLRLLNLSDVSQARPTFTLTARPDSALMLPKDTMVVAWLPVAKDGFDITGLKTETRPADQTVAVGETFDFDYTPTRRGALRLEVRARGGQRRLLVRVPIRVE